MRIQKDKSLLSFGLALFRPRTNDNTAPRPTARHLFIYFCPCATPGAKQDVQLARTGPGQLTFFGDSLNVGRGTGAFPSLALPIAYIRWLAGQVALCQKDYCGWQAFDWHRRYGGQ